MALHTPRHPSRPFSFLPKTPRLKLQQTLLVAPHRGRQTLQQQNRVGGACCDQKIVDHSWCDEGGFAIVGPASLTKNLKKSRQNSASKDQYEDRVSYFRHTTRRVSTIWWLFVGDRVLCGGVTDGARTWRTIFWPRLVSYWRSKSSTCSILSSSYVFGQVCISRTIGGANRMYVRRREIWWEGCRHHRCSAVEKMSSLITFSCYR